MKPLKKRFADSLPGAFFLETETPGKIQDYLSRQNWTNGFEKTVEHVEKPGDGNMNFVLRVEFQDGDSLILKQARPWVEKYPQYEAPLERLKVEKRYYEVVTRDNLLRAFSPELIGFDPKSNIMAIEDLGQAVDLTFIYKINEQPGDEILEECLQYLNRLQRLPAPKSFPGNLGMRQLNHQHIFKLPFMQDNGFELDQIQPGLKAIANKYAGLNVSDLGEKYLGKGTTLAHGDFFPGSLLQSAGQLKVIDPEFAFIAPAEWDIAIFTAHLYMAGWDEPRIKSIFDRLEPLKEFDFGDFSGFTGVEVMRRLIGLAQLPLELTLEEKDRLLEKASQWMHNRQIPALA